MKWPCERCGEDTRMYVKVLVSAPSDNYCALSKSAMKKKEVRLEAADWEYATFICMECGKTHYLNEHPVRTLSKENAELKEENERLKEQLETFEAEHYNDQIGK